MCVCTRRSWLDTLPSFLALSQLFYSFFKTLVGKEIAVELKNDVALVGTLHSVDQYLNIKLLSVAVVDGDKFPQLVRASAQCKRDAGSRHALTS